MDVSIITVTWNSKKLIQEQITSILKGCREISCEHIIIDNDSSDGTYEYIKQQFPHVKLLPNHTNLGFAAANNRALSVAHGDFFLFLNPDMRIEPGSIDILVHWMKQRPDVAIVSPKLIDEHGQLNAEALPRRFPKLWEQVALILKLPHLFPRILDTYLMKDFDPQKEQAVDSVRGSFMLMRKELVTARGWAFDPRYFIWYEDVDICKEATQLGYSVVYTPIVSAVDYVGQSFKQRTTVWKQRHFTKSMLVYFKKWEPWYVWIWIAAVRPLGILLAFISEKIHNARRKKKTV